MLDRIWLRGLFGCCFIALLTGCVESSFDLAKEMRLPKWFSLPSGLHRSDVRVTLDYYTSGRVVFKMYKNNRYFSIDRATGHAQIKELKVKMDTNMRTISRYPIYMIVSIDGVKEIIEHRAMEPIFYLVDDPLLLKK